MSEMIKKQITPENLDDYRDVMPPDVAENIGRRYIMGLALHNEDGTLAAALVAATTGAGWDGDEKKVLIEWGYVSEDENALGIFDFLREEAVKDGIVSVSTIVKADDERTIAILKQRGYSMKEREDISIELTVKEISEVKLGRIEEDDGVIPIRDLTIRQFRRGLTNMIFHGARGLLEDAEYLTKSWFEQDLSFFTQNGSKYSAAMLVRKTSSGILIPVLFFAMEPDPSASLLKLMRHFAMAASDLYPPETKVRIARFSSSTRALTTKLWPDKKGTPVYIFYRNL